MQFIPITILLWIHLVIGVQGLKLKEGLSSVSVSSSLGKDASTDPTKQTGFVDVIQQQLKHRDQQAKVCNAGSIYTPCLDVEACAAQGPVQGRYAFVLTYTGLIHRRLAFTSASRRAFLPYIDAMAKQAKEHNIDILLLIPQGDQLLLSEEDHQLLKQHHVRLILADWTIPPNMKFVQKRWCGRQDLIRLHVLGLEEYDAVAYYDDDVELQGDVTSVLRCAATGKFVTTSGQFSPMNLGFFAVRPQKRLLKAAISFAQQASYDSAKGWAEAGYGVQRYHYPGAECGQGFFHTFFFMRDNPVVQSALDSAGFNEDDVPVSAATVDQCIWNYQGQDPFNPCRDNFSCAQVRAHHKPPKDDHISCTKRSAASIDKAPVPETASEVLGLPVSRVTPGWLANEDLLSSDPRKSFAAKGGMLLAQPVLTSSYIHEWGDDTQGQIQRPQWLRACLATNKAYVGQHDHTMVLRWKSSLQTPPWLESQCTMNLQASPIEMKNCKQQNERDTFNWEKERMMLDYLLSSHNFSHVLVMDADAALVSPKHDTLQELARELEHVGKELLLTNEDWLVEGADRINGGLLFAKNTPFTKALFADMLDAHYLGTLERPRIGGGTMRCGSNEQICFNNLRARPEFQEKTLILSGRRYNRGACVLSHCGASGGASDLEMKTRGMMDPDLHVMHFMGSSKAAAAQALCQNIPALLEEGNYS